MKTKQEAALKLIKMLNLYNNVGATDGEKQAAQNLIIELCSTYHFRIQGNMIIDEDVERRNNEQKFNELNQNKPPIPTEINPYQTNQYVIYKGVRYYKQKGKGPPVPRSEYERWTKNFNFLSVFHKVTPFMSIIKMMILN
jgi:hypothetical protein